ncbi:hypothetical protein REPUB_Repub08aG0027200 [Reevesia pubescens]
MSRKVFMLSLLEFAHGLSAARKSRIARLSLGSLQNKLFTASERVTYRTGFFCHDFKLLSSKYLFLYHVDDSILDYQLLNLEIPTISIVGSLIKAGIPVLVYSGDQDSVIPLTGSRSLVHGLAKELGLETTVPYRVGFEGKQERRASSVDSRLNTHCQGLASQSSDLSDIMESPKSSDMSLVSPTFSESFHSDSHIVAIDSGVPRGPPVGKRANDQVIYPKLVELLLNSSNYSSNLLHDVTCGKLGSAPPEDAETTDIQGTETIKL